MNTGSVNLPFNLPPPATARVNLNNNWLHVLCTPDALLELLNSINVLDIKCMHTKGFAISHARQQGYEQKKSSF
jgi:hypothetical protein